MKVLNACLKYVAGLQTVDIFDMACLPGPAYNRSATRGESRGWTGIHWVTTIADQVLEILL